MDYLKKGLLLTSFAIALIIAGVLYLLGPAQFEANARTVGETQNTARLAAVAPQLQQTEVYQWDVPAVITLPRLGVQLDVKIGERMASGEWPLNSTHAFYAPQSATPLLYGHNINSVFAPLAGIAKDEQLIITLQDGRKLVFAYVDDRFVSPNDGEVLQTKLANSVLLLTCAGQFSEQRRVLHFAFIGEF